MKLYNLDESIAAADEVLGKLLRHERFPVPGGP
jgi:hypothetical protein